jgi:hypothetical protein
MADKSANFRSGREFCSSAIRNLNKGLASSKLFATNICEGNYRSITEARRGAC